MTVAAIGNRSAAGETSRPQSSRKVCTAIAVFAQAAPGKQFSAKSWPFCQHQVYPVLDSHRYKGKNTHELIVLPAIRQVLPADPAMRRNRLSGGMLWLAGSVAVSICQRPKPLPPPAGFILARGLSVGALAPGPRTAFDPDQNIHGRQDAKRLPEDLTAR